MNCDCCDTPVRSDLAKYAKVGPFRNERIMHLCPKCFGEGMRSLNYIRSMNNVKITFRDIKPNMIKVDSIMLHAAKTCRFHGMVNGWYSNAEHAILGSYQSKDRYIQRAFLIHDFGEHITQDVASPIKKACPDYDKLCDKVQSVMNFHFIGCYNLPSEVKAIDKQLCATEQKHLRKAPAEDLEAHPYAVSHQGMFENVPGMVCFQKWEWMQAYIALQHRFIDLFPEYKDSE